MKRILSSIAALSVCLCLTAGAVPRAEAAAFTDIRDTQTQQDVQTLWSLGVIDGTGAGTFRPEGTLTRAEFCKMAIVMLGKKGAVGQYQTYTIFPDVRASHWAAGYINLAVRSEEKLIAGYPDGRFHPDDRITFGQTVTILMRMLGYQDSDVGAIWPQGYINTAATIGLTDGAALTGNAVLTRAQAAHLFCNLLKTDQKEGGAYLGKLGTLREDVILTDMNATASDGSSGGIQIQDGTVYKAADRALGTELSGQRGALLLNASGRVLAFLPDRAASQRTVTVAQADADGIVDTDGKKHTIPSDAVAYYRGEKTAYADIFFDLRAGSGVTFYYNAAGKMEYLFAGTAKSEDAVVVTRQGSTAGFERLTDSKNYTIYKNGRVIGERDLAQYDVATYDKRSGTVRVSDLRLTGYWSDASPSPYAAKKVTVLGHTFDVLPSGAEALAQFKVGTQVTLLLTEEHQVAGAVDPKVLRGNATGIAVSVTSSSAKVELFCGITLEGNPGLREDNVWLYEGQLVSVSSYQGGNQISLSRLTSGGVRGDLDVPLRKVGDTPLSDGVRIFDKVGSGPMTQVTLSDINRTKVAAQSILYSETDSTGQVNLLVLDNQTGDAFTYGRLRYTAPNKETGSMPQVRVESGGTVTQDAVCSELYGGREFGGLAIYRNKNGVYLTAGDISMHTLNRVTPQEWNSSESVTVGGKTYPVAKNVVCYNKTTGAWMTVSQARAYGSDMTLYYDAVGEKIRIVVIA